MLKTMRKYSLVGLVSLPFVLPQQTLAQMPDLEVYQEDCLASAKEAMASAKAEGVNLTRSQVSKHLAACGLRNTERQLAAVRKARAVLTKRLAEQNLELDEQNRVLDSQGRELAALKERQWELVWVINSSNARTREMLQEAEVIVRRLAQ